MLAEIGADHIPQLLVFNKMDALDGSLRPMAESDSYELAGREHRRVFVSALTGSGLGVLRSVLSEIVAKESDQMSPAPTVELT